jgi:polysaccharide chain length determinant protein (PEP-CTERM system associated)
MGNLDVTFYWAVFLRRLPYFLVIAALLTAIAVTVAYILPPVYRSSASMLVEPQQIPDELAATTVPVDPYEQAQIIEQRLMTRANLLALAELVGIYADQPDMPAGMLVGDIRDRIEFIGFIPDVTRRPGTPGATIIGVAFEAPTPELATKGANELVSLILQENVKLRTGRAGDTLEFFEGEVARLADALERKSQEIADFKTANVAALPDSLDARRAQQLREEERLLTLEREEATLRNQRATVVWVFERTGRSSSLAALTPEEEELQALKSQLVQQSAIYKRTSPTVRVLENRIAVLEALVEEQRAARALPGEDGEAVQPLSELEIELAPIDERLKFIAEEKAMIEATLAELESSIQATPANEMVLTGLERELASLQAESTQAVANRGQAQVGERIEVLSKGERFSLIEAPTTPPSPYKPNRLLIVGAGMVGGLGAGIGFIVLMEMLNRSIRRPVDLSAGLGLQPFATVPYIHTQGETRRKRGAVVTALALIAVGIPAGLLAVHTYYMPLDLLWSQTLQPDTSGPVAVPATDAATDAATGTSSPAPAASGTTP